MSKRVAINYNRSSNNMGSSVKGFVCFPYLNEIVAITCCALLLLTDSPFLLLAVALLLFVFCSIATFIPFAALVEH